MVKDFRQFLKLAREAGPDYYLEAKRPVSPVFETSILQKKIAEQKRFPVLYYPRIEGSKLPYASGLFSSYELLGMALDMDPKKAVSSSAFHKQLFNEYRRRRDIRVPVKSVPAAQAQVKEVVLKGKDVDLGLLPISFQEEHNSGKYITIGSMICKVPDTGKQNVGVYRHEVKGKNKLGAMINPANHGYYIGKSYADLGKPMEVAIFLGHHPAAIFGSVFSGDIDVKEMEVMGGFLGEPLLVTRAETVDLDVPAYAEIVIEGVIDPGHMVTDGPFSEWNGHYGGVHECFLIDVTAITMRHDAIYHDVIAAHREHNMSCVLSVESCVYDSVKMVVPSVQAVHLPASGGNLILVYVSIKTRVPGSGKRAGLAAINTAQASNTMAIVVDDDIDVYNEEEVLWAVATRVVADQDIDIIPRIQGGHLIPSNYDETRTTRGYMMSKMVIDATKPVELPWSERIIPPKDVWARIKARDYFD